MLFPILLLAALLVPELAVASGGGADGGQLTLVVVLLGVVGGAYLLTHYVVDWLQRLFLVATSVEYLILGVLIGIVLVPDPATRAFGLWIQENTILGALPWPAALDNLALIAPLIELAAGWIGLRYGMSLDVWLLMSRRDGALRLAVIEGVLTVVPVTLAAWAVMRASVPPELYGGMVAPIALCATVLGVTAWAGSTSAMDVVSRRYGVNGELLATLVRGARFSDMLAMLAFGVIFATFHGVAVPDLAENAPTARVPTPVEWSVITVATGLALGVLFAWFLDQDDSDNGTLLALVGIIAFASGAAYFLDLSALTINLVLGMVLVNVSTSAPKVRRALKGTHRPMNLLLVLLAGLLWDPPPLLLTLALTGTILIVRSLGKVAAGFVASASSGLRRDVFRGLIGQGEVAIAMAVSFKLVYDVAMPASAITDTVAGFIDATYTAILIGVVLHEIVAPRLLKGLLVDAGEIRSESGVGG